MVDRCVCCGEVVPEGQMVCPNCLLDAELDKRCETCSHVAVCGKYQATGGHVRNCRHYLMKATTKHRLTDANAIPFGKFPYPETDWQRGWNEALYAASEAAPTVYAAEVVHSSWVLNADGSGTCKHCHRTTKNCWDYDGWMNYCPDCGSKMDGEPCNNP